jgi:hypothetical protein
MAVLISCPSCGTQFKAPERAVGHSVKCLKCGTRIAVLPTATPLVQANRTEITPPQSLDSAHATMAAEPNPPTALLTALLITGSAFAFLLLVVVLVLILVKNGMGPIAERRQQDPPPEPSPENVAPAPMNVPDATVDPLPKTLKQELPNPPPLAMANRAERLAQLESDEKAALEMLSEKQAFHKNVLQKLRKEEDDLYKKSKFTPPKITARIPMFLKEQNAAVRQANKDTLALLRKREEFLQAKRKLIIENPLPGDPKLSEYAGLILTEDEISDLGKQALSAGSPRAAAQPHLASATGAVTTPTYNGAYQDPADADVVAVAYKVAAYRGKVGQDMQAHVFVYHWRGAWVVLDLPGRPNSILPGPPPSDYKRRD